MKIKKNKYIRLTETQLNNIIKEKVNESINKILQEHADPRKDVINTLKNYFAQLAENWCLVHYCTLVNEDVNNCKNHWRTELWAIIGKMGSFKLKGNNDYNNRTKVIKTAENIKELLTDFDVIYGNVRAKFAKEKINNEEVIETTINDLINAKKDIIHCIANFNRKEIFDYINNI